MSYADDLAKDRDKYLRQRNELMRLLRSLCEEIATGTFRSSMKARNEASEAIKKIEESEAGLLS